MGAMFHAIGLLATADVVSISATDLIGQYVGQTAPKTRAQLSKALGKVLVIEDAHNLHNSSTFASEALAELVAFLANPQHANRLVVILTGQTLGINALMASEPALAAHFHDELVFADLGPRACVGLLGQELGRLGVLPRGEGEGGDDALPPFLAEPQHQGYAKLQSVFEELSRLPSWSNARHVRALATRVARAQMVAAAGPSDAEGRLDEVVERCAREMLSTQRERCGGSGGGVVQRRPLRRKQQQEEQLVQSEMAEAPPLPPPPAVMQETKAMEEGMAEERVVDGEGKEEDGDKDRSEDEGEEERTGELSHEDT